MNDDKDKQAKTAAAVFSEDDEDEDQASESSAGGGESLLSLVKPEMITLSKHWLDALKDHALLSLPPGGPFDATTFKSKRVIIDTLENTI